MQQQPGSVEEQSSETLVSQGHHSAIPSKPLKTLIVEDSPQDAALILGQLKLAGYEMFYDRVETSEGFLLALQQQDWDIILADYRMPRFSGLKALELLKADGRDIPFILISGKIGEETAVECLKAGVNNCLMKDKLPRLPLLIEKELQEAQVRLKRREAETELKRVNETLETLVKQRTEALQEANNRYHLVLEGSNDGIFDWNIETDELYWNDKLYALHGLSKASFHPTMESFLELVHPDDRHMLQGAIAAHLEKGDKFELELRQRHVDGDYRYFFARAKALRNDQGQAIRLSGSSTDITERKQLVLQLEQAHRETWTLYDWEKKTRKTIQILKETMEQETIFPLLVDAVGQTLQSDRTYVIQFDKGIALPVTYEYRSRPAVTSFAGITPPWDTCPYFQRCARQQMVCVPDVQADTAMLDEEWTQYYAKHGIRGFIGIPVFYRDRILAALILHTTEPRDWTEQEQAFLYNVTEHLAITLYQAQVKRELETTSNMKSHFLSAFSHEIRTPLNSIIGYSNMTLKGLGGPLTPKQEKYLQNVLHSGTHLLDLINDILDISKIESGSVVLSIDDINIAEMMTELEGVVSNFAEQENIQLHIWVQPGLTHVKADRVRLKQILLNLLSNAIKFNNKDSGAVEVRICLSDDRQWFICDVEDCGIGIPEDKLSNLFSEFYQVDNSYSRKQEGTGLGLALTKKLVELHGGTLSVKSEEGVGSTFTFTLPTQAGSDV